MTDVVRVFRRSAAALFGLALVLVMAVLALVAPWLAPRDPDAIDTARRLAPIFTAGHPLGTDEFGRDLLSRLLYGARISLVVGLAATALAAVAGSVCGLLAGVSLLSIFALRTRIARLRGWGALRQPAAGGFELEDILYLIAPLTWFGGLSYFVAAASVGAPLFALWTAAQYLNARRSSPGTE